MSEQQQQEIVRQIGGMLQNFQEKMQIQVDSIKEQMIDMRTEMRDRDNQRHAEMIAMQQKHDADIKELREEFNAKFNDVDKKFDDMEAKVEKAIDHAHNVFIASAVGIGAILIGIITLILR